MKTTPTNLNKYISNNIKIKHKKFALIIGESPSFGARSPKLWNKVYKKKKIKCEMYPADVQENNLQNIVNILKKDNRFQGGSVTIPYKEKIIKYLDGVEPNSKKINAINTILKSSKKLIGINTDYLAFLNSLKKFKLKSNASILCLGAGGAGKAGIISVLENYKRNKKFFFNRKNFKIKKILNKNKEKNCKIIKNYKELKKIKNVSLIINTTSIGFDSWIKKKSGYVNLKYFSPLSCVSKIKPIKKRDEKLFIKKNIELINKNNLESYKFFQRNPKAGVFDIIYLPNKTILIEIAKNFDAITLNGLSMNLDQAVLAFSKVNKFGLIKKIEEIMKK